MYIKLGERKFKLEYSIAPLTISMFHKDGGSMNLDIPAHTLYYNDRGHWVLYAAHPTNPPIYFDDNLIQENANILQEFKEYMLHYGHAIDPDEELDASLLDEIIDSFCNINAHQGGDYDLNLSVLHQYIYQLINSEEPIYLDYNPKYEKLLYSDGDNDHYTIEDFTDFINLQ